MRYYLGGEFVISDLIALRGGYKLHDVEASRWSAGVGLNMPAEWLGRSRIRFDYAYASIDEFDEASHRFSVLVRFNETDERMNAMGAFDRSAIQEELDAAERSRRAAGRRARGSAALSPPSGGIPAAGEPRRLPARGSGDRCGSEARGPRPTSEYPPRAAAVRLRRQGNARAPAG